MANQIRFEPWPKLRRNGTACEHSLRSWSRCPRATISPPNSGPIGCDALRRLSAIWPRSERTALQSRSIAWQQKTNSRPRSTYTSKRPRRRYHRRHYAGGGEVNEPPRLKPTNTRDYGKVRNYQAGGDVTPTADQLAQQTTAQLPQQPTADQLAATSERQLSPRYWRSIGMPSLPPTPLAFHSHPVG